MYGDRYFIRLKEIKSKGLYQEFWLIGYKLTMSNREIISNIFF